MCGRDTDLRSLITYAEVLLNYCETGKLIQTKGGSIVNPGSLFLCVHHEIVRIAKGKEKPNDK